MTCFPTEFWCDKESIWNWPDGLGDSNCGIVRKHVKKAKKH